MRREAAGRSAGARSAGTPLQTDRVSGKKKTHILFTYHKHWIFLCLCYERKTTRVCALILNENSFNGRHFMLKIYIMDNKPPLYSHKPRYVVLPEIF